MSWSLFDKGFYWTDLLLPVGEDLLERGRQRRKLFLREKQKGNINSSSYQGARESRKQMERHCKKHDLRGLSR